MRSIIRQTLAAASRLTKPRDSREALPAAGARPATAPSAPATKTSRALAAGAAPVRVDGRDPALPQEPDREIEGAETDCALLSPDAKERQRMSFYRGDTVNYFANRADFESGTFLQDFVLKGWMPSAPFVTRDAKITAFGSCFAANITRHLNAIGYDLSSKRAPDIYISHLGDGMVNTPAILGQFEWALANKKMPENLWHGFKAEGYGYDEGIRLKTRDVFLATDFFIITLGLSEVWYDEQTGGTFWRAVPEGVFDPSRHKFRVLSVEETKRDIEEMRRLIRQHAPNAKILFTVSPIPLAATFRPVSCMTANAVSKAIIRAALDEVLRGHPDELNESLFYFPSMEIVQFVFHDAWKTGRHPHDYVLDTIMKTFEAVYCVGEGTLDEANAMLQMYRVRNMAEIGARTTGKRKVVLAGGKAARQALRARVESQKLDKSLEHVVDTTKAERRAARHARQLARQAGEAANTENVQTEGAEAAAE